MKYVVLQIKIAEDVDKEFIVLFDDFLVHKIVAENLQNAVRQSTNRAATIVSAGFVTLNTPVPKCVGDSESLKLKARPEDSYLLWQLGVK